MARAPREPDAEVPRSFPSVPPPDLSAGTGITRLLIGAVEDAVKELKGDVREIKSHRHSDFVYYVSIFAMGFLMLSGMLIFGYFKLDDKIVSLSNTSIRVETKLEELLRRIPPTPTPASPSR